jgi:hypothetical protein
MADLETLTRNLPVQRRELMVAPGTWNAEALTVDVTWTTGARRTMFDWNRWDYVDEELSLEPGAIRFDRINNGAPVLNSHDSSELDSVIGVVVAGTARIEGGVGIATLQLSRREDVAGIVQDIADGIIRNISVGYMVHQYEVTERPGERPLMRAVDWEPAEISFVPIPADAAATVRSDDTASQGGHPCIIRRAISPANLEASPMADTTTAAAPAPVTVEAAPAPAPAVRAITTTRLLERLDQVGFTAAARAEIIALHDEAPLTERDLNAAIGERFAARDQAAPQRATVQVMVDESEKHRAAVGSALLHRHDPKKYKLENGGENFRGMTLLEIGKDLLGRNGVATRGMDRMEVAGLMLGMRSMHGTSDFPFILANVAGKTLRDSYEAAPQTFKAFCRMATAADFKTMSRTQLGDAPALEKVNESGEYKRGTIGEAREQYALETFGKVVAVSRQVIVNDDLDAFTRVPEKFGRAAADLESNTVWAILTGNPTMGDGVALFHANHGNLAGTGTAISVTSLGAGRAAMRKQTGLNGSPINAAPRFLIVGPDKETEAQQQTAAVLAALGSSVNPFSGTLQVLAEPRISGNTWLMAADSAQVDTVEYAYLSGNEGVYLETRNGFDVDGVEIKARLDFAAKALDWRGLYRNPGA